jgi:hypothetical protein
MKIAGPPALSLTALLCLLASPCLSQTFSLHGYVVDGLTGRPLPAVKLHLYDIKENDPTPLYSSGPAVPLVISESDGHFSFTGLSAQQYTLQAELQNEVVLYGETADPLYKINFRRIPVGPEWEDRTILFRILPRATLAGTVRDEFGEPVPGAEVQLYRLDRRGARINLVPVGATGTDDRGQYSIAELWPGDYVVCAAHPGYRNSAPVGEGPVQYRPGMPTRIYARSCDPDPNSQSSRLRIAAGAQLRIDPVLSSGPAYTVRFTDLYRRGPASSSGQLWNSLKYNDATEFEVQLNDDVALPGGGLEIPNIPPGRYVFEARVIDLAGQGSVARREFIVSDQTPAPVQVTPADVAKIDVHLNNADGGAVGAVSAAVALSFVPTSANLAARTMGSLPNLVLDPGSYWVSIRARQPYCAVSGRLAGQEVLQRRVDLAPSTSGRLDVRLSTRCGSIDIHTVADGNAVPFSDFLLLLSGTPEDPGGVITGGSGPQGQSSIASLAPGRYLLWAWLPDSQGYIGPNLPDSAKDGIELTVAAGETTTVSISPVHSAGASR